MAWLRHLRAAAVKWVLYPWSTSLTGRASVSVITPRGMKGVRAETRRVEKALPPGVLDTIVARRALERRFWAIVHEPAEHIPEHSFSDDVLNEPVYLSDDVVLHPLKIQDHVDHQRVLARIPNGQEFAHHRQLACRMNWPLGVNQPVLVIEDIPEPGRLQAFSAETGRLLATFQERPSDHHSEADPSSS